MTTTAKIYCNCEHTYCTTPTGTWDITVYDVPTRIDAIPSDAWIVTDAEARDVGIEIPSECLS